MHKENCLKKYKPQCQQWLPWGSRELLETKGRGYWEWGANEDLSFHVHILLYYHTFFQDTVLFLKTLSFTLLHFDITYLKQLYSLLQNVFDNYIDQLIRPLFHQLSM